MSIKHLSGIVILFIILIVLLITVPNICSNSNNDNLVFEYWQKNRHQTYINYDSLMTVWPQFYTSSHIWYENDPELFHWYMNRRLDLAYLYLNAGEIYEQFKTLLKNRCPDFNDFKEVDYSSNQGTQYFVELLNILKQTSNPDLKNKRNRQQLLTMIEIAALLNDSLLVQNTFKIIDKYYQDDFDKETYFNDLYAPDGAYMLYQLFSGARCIGYENSEFCRFWFNEYDSFIKQIYNYNIYQDTDHHKLYKIIENDPIKISLYTYIIPDLCLQTLSNAPWNTMPVLERDKIYNYTSRIILMANTGHYRLDIILLSLVYNYDHLGYLGVILGEMRKTEQGGLKQLSPLNNSLSAYMLSNCIESKN